MGRNAIAATSLVAALPAGFLAYLCIMAFVRYAGNMSTGMIVINSGATMFSVLLAITPIALLIGRRRDKTETAEDAGEEAAAEDEGDAPEAAVATAADDAPATFDDDIDAAETDAYDFDADSFDDAESEDEGDQFEFDDDDDEFK